MLRYKYIVCIVFVVTIFDSHYFVLPGLVLGLYNVWAWGSVVVKTLRY